MEASAGQNPGEQLVGTVLEERHLAAGDSIERSLVDVEDPDPQAGIGEHEAQRQADVAPASEHDEIKIDSWHRADSSSRLGPGGVVQSFPANHPSGCLRQSIA